MLALTGVLSIALGVLLFTYPSAGILSLLLFIGAYALVSGVAMVALALKLRTWVHHERRTPLGGVPSDELPAAV